MASANSMHVDLPCSNSADGEMTTDSRNKIQPVESSAMAKTGTPSAGRFHELLRCPLCANLMYPPILQCPRGHTLCSSCKLKAKNQCPTCRHELGDIRCLALEKVAESLQFPCQYEINGCAEILRYCAELKHEQSCKFRPYNCPYAGEECHVAGDIPMLLDHLKKDHQVDTHDGCTFNHRYVKSGAQEIENAIWMLTVFSCFGQHFCLHFEAFLLGTAPVYMAFLRFMGEDAETKSFGYSLEVGGNGRKLAWHGVPRSIRDDPKTVRDSYDGLVIHRRVALSFSGGDPPEVKLRVTGRIWKNNEQ